VHQSSSRNRRSSGVGIMCYMRFILFASILHVVAMENKILAANCDRQSLEILHLLIGLQD
jgi:hypothetical protein